jgi:hypothetical protein
MYLLGRPLRARTVVEGGGRAHARRMEIMRTRSLFVALPLLTALAACGSEPAPAPVVAAPPPAPVAAPPPVAVPPGIDGRYMGALRPVRGATRACRAAIPAHATGTGPNFAFSLGRGRTATTASGALTPGGTLAISGDISGTGTFARRQLTGQVTKGECTYNMVLTHHVTRAAHR